MVRPCEMQLFLDRCRSELSAPSACSDLLAWLRMSRSTRMANLILCRLLWLSPTLWLPRGVGTRLLMCPCTPR